LIDLERGAKIYCGLLLEREEADYAKQVLVLVKEKISQTDVEGKLLKGEACRQLGKLVESVNIYYDIRETDFPGWETMAVGAIGDLLDSGYEKSWGSTKRPSEFIVQCTELTKLLVEKVDADWKAPTDLVRAETAVLTGNVELCEKILNEMQVDGYSDDPGWIRCMGRLHAAKGDFENAAIMWSKVRESMRGSSGSDRSMPWWRSKYYELSCWSKRDKAKSDEIVRPIEVLQNSIDDIPDEWAGKLETLKKAAKLGI